MDPETCGAAANASSVGIAPPESGWYVYGVTLRSHGGEPELVLGPGLDGGEPVQVLPAGELAAIASRVSLAEFGAEELRARVQEPAWMELMVRGHERVVEAVQRQRPVLPAKFGCVWRSDDDLTDLLARDRDALFVQLRRVEGCDEWGVRLHADRVAIERCVASSVPGVRQLEQEIATARPGRAYFLQRKLADVLAAAADQALSDLANAGHDHLARHCAASRISTRTDAPSARHGEIEILRAAFLVRRTGLAAFVDEIGRFTAGATGLRCEYSGPWPPYSFVTLPEEGSR